MSYKTNEEIIQILSEKYRGLRPEDLEEMNPEYSCVICMNDECKRQIAGKTKCRACQDCIKATEEEFAKRYEF